MKKWKSVRCSQAERVNVLNKLSKGGWNLFSEFSVPPRYYVNGHPAGSPKVDLLLFREEQQYRQQDDLD